MCEGPNHKEVIEKSLEVQINYLLPVEVKVTQGGCSNIIFILLVLEHGSVGDVVLVGQEVPPSWYQQVVHTGKDNPTLEMKKFRSNIN